MTDKQFEKIKKGLNFYSECGINNLCTMTETALRAILDDATKELEAKFKHAEENCINKTCVVFKDKEDCVAKLLELEKENERLAVSYETLKLHDEEEIGMLKSENAELKTVIALKDEEMGCIETVFNTFKSQAKEIIKKLIEAIHIWDCKNLEQVEAEAEQFLSEVEK